MSDDVRIDSDCWPLRRVVTHRLPPGIYEDLLTTALEAAVDARKSEGWRMGVSPSDATARPEFLARHVHGLLRRALEAIPGDDDAQATAQIDLANRLVEVLFEHGALADDRVAEAARLLLEAAERPGLGGVPSPIPRPTLSLRKTGLLVNGRRDVQIASEIAREIPSADRIDLLCAFVRHSGLRLFRAELDARVREEAQVRVIASVYTGSTERRALDDLVALGARVKVSYEIARTRLHAKAWLFHRDSGLHTAYIGSSNLTHTAQIEGLEWNVRVSAARTPRSSIASRRRSSSTGRSRSSRTTNPGATQSGSTTRYRGRVAAANRTMPSKSRCWSTSHRSPSRPWHSRRSSRSA